jgi:hypothetical protein
MANTLDNIMPKILARGLLTLREQAIMPRLVNGDYSTEAAEKGDTIDVPIPTANSASDVTPGPVYSSATNTTPGKVQVTLNNWKKSNFHLSDKDMTEINRNRHFLPMQMQEAIRALANAVNEDIHAEYQGIYGYTGTAGTTPFASTVTDATNARKVLHQQRAPRTERRGVLDFDAEANALALAPFSDADKIGSNQVRIEGEIGRKYGIDWYADDAVTSHTTPTTSSALVVGSAVAAGASSIDITGGNNVTLNKGDIFTIAGDTQTYVLNASVAVVSTGNTAASISPVLAAAASSEAITLKASHVVNLAFHRDAFAFANRPLVASTQDMSLGSRIMSMTDPQTGITLRLEVSRQYKQVQWEFDILWGAKLVRPELATRIAG